MTLLYIFKELMRPVILGWQNWPWGLGSRKIHWEAGVFWGGFLAIYEIYQVYRARGSPGGARIVANQPSQPLSSRC